jgi:hypothetical protein
MIYRDNHLIDKLLQSLNCEGILKLRFRCVCTLSLSEVETAIPTEALTFITAFTFFNNIIISKFFIMRLYMGVFAYVNPSI